MFNAFDGRSRSATCGAQGERFVSSTPFSPIGIALGVATYHRDGG
jgi:hypothetical protein